MGSLLTALAALALLVVPSLASLDLLVHASPTALNIGESATVEVQVRENLGPGTWWVYQVGGRVDATQNVGDPLGGLSASLPSPIENFWAPPLQNPIFRPRQDPGVGTNGGLTEFGSSQHGEGSTTFGSGVFATVCTYTITGASPGTVFLNFNPPYPNKTAGGFFVGSQGNPVVDSTIRTNTGVVITITPEPATLAMLGVAALLVPRCRRA